MDDFKLTFDSVKREIPCLIPRPVFTLTLIGVLTPSLIVSSISGDTSVRWSIFSSSDILIAE